jgi:hypothetical protein
MLMLRLAAFLSLSSALSFAGSWLTQVDRDKNLEIRYCSPSTKTKFFEVIQPDGMSFNFDSAGNAKAVELVRKTGKKPLPPSP